MQSADSSTPSSRWRRVSAALRRRWQQKPDQATDVDGMECQAEEHKDLRAERDAFRADLERLLAGILGTEASGSVLDTRRRRATVRRALDRTSRAAAATGIVDGMRHGRSLDDLVIGYVRDLARADQCSPALVVPVIVGALDQRLLSVDAANAALGIEAEHRRWYKAATSYFADVEPGRLADLAAVEAVSAYLNSGNEELFRRLLDSAAELPPRAATAVSERLLAGRRFADFDLTVRRCSPQDRAALRAKKDEMTADGYSVPLGSSRVLLSPLAPGTGTETDAGRKLVYLAAVLLLEAVCDGIPAAQRDQASDACREGLPDRLWSIAAGHGPVDSSGRRQALPSSRPVHQIFAGWSMSDVSVLTEEAIKDLRRAAPIGCADWFSVDLLLNAGVDAFRSGCLTATLTSDALELGPESFLRVAGDAAPGSASCLASSIDTLHGLASASHPPRVEDPDVASAAAAVGIPITTRPRPRGNESWDGLLDIAAAPERHLELGVRLKEALIETLSLSSAGAEPARVYDLWGTIWAEDVAAAKYRLDAPMMAVPPPFDVHATAESVRDAMRILGPQPSADVVDIALALDTNLLDQLPVTLEGVARNTSSPVRAWVLGRGLSPGYQDWLSSAFPTLTLAFLPCEAADYGYASLLSHITESTMDRLLLPLLLPDVQRIVYVDIDALFLGDIAELHGRDLGDAVMAARPHGMGQSTGLSALRAAARSLRSDTAAELRRRVLKERPGEFAGWNAGVMVLDLNRMRADRFCEEHLGWSERYGFGDQRTLMFYSAGRFTELEARWNMWPMHEPTGDAAVLHWIGPAKPWSDLAVPRSAEWRHYEASVLDRAGSAPK